MMDYPTMAEVLAMHADLIERYGGSHSVRDPRRRKISCSRCMKKTRFAFD
jgi:hypothetical protein